MQDHQFSLDFNDDDVIQFSENSLNRFNKLRRAIWENGKVEIENKINEILNQLSTNGSLNIPPHYTYTDLDDNQQKLTNHWSQEGVHCEVLRLGSKQWEKGKIRVRFTVEFIPDELENNEPESPLDEIRREIKDI